MTTVIRRFAFVLAVLAAAPSAHARVNLNNFGVSTTTRIDGGGGGIDGGGVIDPVPQPPGGGGAPTETVSSLEAKGYLCASAGGDDVFCRHCQLEPTSETNSCALHLCKTSGSCSGRRQRWGVPRDVKTEDFGMWAKEFSFGASSYWLGDFNGDGRRDLGAQQGATVQAAMSQNAFFQNVGNYTGPAPVESAGPSALADVNHDGIVDLLSVSPAGHLQVAIRTGIGVAATVEIPSTWCEGAIGTCLIGDVDGDGMPDLVEVMRGAVDGHRAGDVWVSLANDVPGFPSVPANPVPPDTDGDGVRDNVDNCLDLSNPTQLDGDGDGIGNACDADLNGDGIVNQTDVDAFTLCLGANVAVRPACAAVDLDGDGFVGFSDAALMQSALGQPPGRAAANQPPEIELFTPADGTILPPNSTQAWVAGFVPNLPPGSVELRIAGQPVSVSGPSNYFSQFVNIPNTTPSGQARVFRSIVVEAKRGTRQAMERRAVLVGDHASPGHRAHSALGARLTSAGFDRVEQYVKTAIVPQIVQKIPAGINGHSSIFECVALGTICATDTTVTNAVIGTPTVSADLQPGGIHVHASVSSLDLDLSIDGFGPTPVGWSCGGHVKATAIEIDLRYGLAVDNGRVQVHELQEPSVTANISYGGCSGDNVKKSVISKLSGFLNDADDVNGATHGIYQRSPIGGAIEDVFAGLDVSGTVTRGGDLPVLTQTMTFALPGKIATVLDDPLSFLYDARFEYVTQDAAGISLWLGVSIEPESPIPGLGGPQGAYQLPLAVAPALPNALESGSPFDIAAAVTPNGLNELLDAVTRAGVLAKEARVVTEVTNPLDGLKTPLTGFLIGRVMGIQAFNAYPALETFKVLVSPPAIAPVVSGLAGPKGEMLDVHVPQVGISIVDESGDVAVALRADFRVGVNVGLSSGGSGKLTAFAQGFQLLDSTIVENPIAADPQQVKLRILCEGLAPADPVGCAIKDQLLNGLGIELESIELPALSGGASGSSGFALAPRCLERLNDGTLVAEFGLVLPGEPLPPALPAHAAIAAGQCSPPLVATDVTSGGSGGLGGPLQGTIGTSGTLETRGTFTPQSPTPTKLTTATASTTTRLTTTTAPTSTSTTTKIPLTTTLLGTTR